VSPDLKVMRVQKVPPELRACQVLPVMWVQKVPPVSPDLKVMRVQKVLPELRAYPALPVTRGPKVSTAGTPMVMEFRIWRRM